MKKYDLGGCFGIERETLRVDSAGQLAQTPHPFAYDPHITRDFCENQIELVTPVADSIDGALQHLGKLDKQVRDMLSQNGETLWLYSNPPHFDSENEIPIADFTGDHSSKRQYREVLEQKYGKKLMLFSGIHFNFSFSEDYLHTLNTKTEDFRSFRDSLYLRLYKQLMRHSFLLVLLTAASPVYDLSLDSDGKCGIIKSEYSSMRNSERGYWNRFLPVLDHSSLRAFTDSIRRYVDSGALYSASELYLPVRLKPQGVNSLENLAEHGVDHIELRMFDLNPEAPLGIDGRDLKFAHLLMLWLLSLPDFDFTPELQAQAVQAHQKAALLEPDAELLARAEAVLTEMEQYFSDDAEALAVIGFEHDKLNSRKAGKTITDNYFNR
ncbi:MAG: glutathione synthase [Oscillospiraceae bacterium]|nr:glutathione synthase [Oscillospiraceae bacterium]